MKCYCTHYTTDSHCARSEALEYHCNMSVGWRKFLSQMQSIGPSKGGISYREGVVLCERYDKPNGHMFKQFIYNHFNNTFQLSNKGNSRIFVQDGDPCQNSAAAKSALAAINAQVFHIPPRSPCRFKSNTFLVNLSDIMRGRINVLKYQYVSVNM